MKNATFLVVCFAVFGSSVAETEYSTLPANLWSNKDNFSNFLLLASSSPVYNRLNWSNALILCLFSPIILISLCGNILVCRTFIKNRRLCSNLTNLLILLLATSDLLMTLFNIPFTVLDIVLRDWIFGPYVCTVVSFVQANSVYVSTFSMAAIAASRHRVIYKGLQGSFQQRSCSPTTGSRANRRQALVTDNAKAPRLTRCCCCCFPNRLCRSKSRRDHNLQISMELQNVEPTIKAQKEKSRFCVKLNDNTRLSLLIFSIWFLAALHSLPHTIFNRVKTIRIDVLLSANETQFEEVTVRRCIPVFPTEFKHFNLYLTLFTFSTQYVIPLSFAGIIYLRIALAIQSQGRVGQISRLRAAQLTSKKRRRLLLLVMIWLAFALSWLPFNSYYLLIDLGIIKTNYATFLTCLWLATASVMYNPILYCWLNEHFQKEAKLVLRRIKTCCSLRA